MPGRLLQRRPAYADIALYVSQMEEKNLSYLNLLAFIHFLTMDNEETKSIILSEVEGDFTRITYEVITIVQCLQRQQAANGFE